VWHITDNSSNIFYIEQETGKNIRQVTSELAFSSALHAVCQLVNNGYDADASLVDIILNERQDSLTISDNGDGMDRRGLNSFFRLFESDKLDEPISKKGRHVLGKKGIAKGGIRFLSFAYELETTQGSQTLKVREFFARELVKYSMQNTGNDGDEPSYREQKRTLELVLSGKTPKIVKESEICRAVEKCLGPLETIENKGELGKIAVAQERAAAGAKGTKITMGPLTSGRNILPLDTDNMEAYLRKNIGSLLSAGFVVKINGSTLSPVIPENAFCYEYQETLPRSGKVSCRIYYILDQDKSNPLRGINLYVDNFRVGSLPGMDFDKLRFSIANRLWVQIHIDSLRDKIQLDHLGVAEDHPKILEAKEWLSGKIKTVVKDVQAMERVGAERKLESIMASVSRRLANATGRQIVVKLGTETEAGASARYDNSNGIIYINEALRIKNESSYGTRLNQQLFDHSLLAFTMQSSLAGTPGSAAAQARLSENFAALSSKGFSKVRTLGSLVHAEKEKDIMRDPLQIGINPNRLYRPSELVEISGREPIVFGRAIASGLLPDAPVIKGEDALGFLRTIHGGLTVEEIVRRFTDTKMALFYTVAQKLKRNLSQAGLPDYAKDISLNNVPFYWIKSGKQQQFVDDYSGIRGQRQKKSPGQELIKPGDAVIYLLKETGLSRITPALLTRMERDGLIRPKEWRSPANLGYKRADIEEIASKLKNEDALVIKYGL